MAPDYATEITTKSQLATKAKVFKEPRKTSYKTRIEKSISNLEQKLGYFV